ncbi:MULTISPECIES: formate/nitrite transporter family protein [unclassified Paenibacillus]|uniref:formate/nitrite transporter family protein n=1 Tax=unclassified Paenibacillus TaxID=185978 RepID=UPI0024063C99|nr:MULTISPECIES: formate/nitrite transporter family protein [unclassified Paenibacillus]MDF9839236.1 formate/nitrite transporter [Paenibacillus sp. PastF-2]MDF9845817.1 formate/nitrite transporter [Paenibacillus sp. PastM-2]MDF9852390.1 formate/nitrite transporter [Paenibacillus sp. PastF-1]MDH6477880.1 formate/nitrite transporter [Paenibacillus sp. PastH-2]MDH6505619.1 formate/nitrite transporter [Paenibacillus sp. PastM-3]
MDYVKPNEVLSSMIEAGKTKAELSILQLIVRGGLGGAILACATTLAYTAAAQTKLPMIGALLFPVGFVMIILLGFELVTGSFALIPLAVLEKKTNAARMLNNFFWVIIGHLIGCAVYAALYGLTITKMGTDMSNPMIQTLITTSEAKTTAYKSMGADGMGLAFIKAILCNWMVTLGAVLAMTSKSTAGKIAAMWLPILTFFAQGFEHTVVNMFVIPAGMMLGANVSFADWWIWNGIPVLLGNLVGGVLFTGLLIYLAQNGFRSGRAATTVAMPTGHGEGAIAKTATLEKSL